MERCAWVSEDPLYLAYHDEEWGVPQHNPRVLWEQLVLESFQSGLSWITILRKREGFRAAFAGFEPERVAAFDDADVARLLEDTGIVRHRGKIEATIRNARAFEAMGGARFKEMVWEAVGGVPVQNGFRELSEVPAKTPASERLAKALKAAGFGFCGPTTVYAFMQAAGLVNDHVVSCGCHDRVAALGAG